MVLELVVTLNIEGWRCRVVEGSLLLIVDFLIVLKYKEELDSLFRQKDLIKEYDEIGHAYDSYEASFAEIITPGGYKRLAAKLKELHSYFENYGSGNLLSNCKVVQAIEGEQQLKPVGVEDQNVTDEQQVKQGPELLPSGEYFTAEFLSHLYDAI